MGNHSTGKTGAHSLVASSSKKAIPLFIAAAVAFVLAMGGSASAALTYFSPDYAADIVTTEIDVSLSEQGDNQSSANIVEADGDLLEWIGTSAISLGKVYGEQLSAVNTGTQDEYVRVVVHKYWKDADGKAVDLDPALIELAFVYDGWIVDETLSTPEQTVLYSIDPLAVGASQPFVESFSISPTLLDAYTTTVAGNVTTVSYDYSGYSFGIYAEVDSVQTHNGLAAVRDIWGAGANVTDQMNFDETE